MGIVSYVVSENCGKSLILRPPKVKYKTELENEMKFTIFTLIYQLKSINQREILDIIFTIHMHKNMNLFCPLFDIFFGFKFRHTINR